MSVQVLRKRFYVRIAFADRIGGRSSSHHRFMKALPIFSSPAAFRFSAIWVAACSLALADGQADYTAFCSACHGIDGKGAGDGAFPPLAESPWVAGEQGRAIKVVLHGLAGPVTVGEKTFNLEMPPQGGVLKDDQIAGILSYVRSSWGNKGAPVSAVEVETIRSATSKRTDHWTAEELLKIHPLETTRPPIKHLISKVYHGEWDRLPDFSKLEAKSVEEEHDGRISVDQSDRRDHYGIVWDGELEIAEDGSYTFELQADDAAAVYVGGELIAKVDGIGPMSVDRSQTKTLPLMKGDHPIRIDYLEAAGNESILLRFKKEGEKNWKLLSARDTAAGGAPMPAIPITPKSGEAVMYRNFIEDVSPRAIGVGYDGGVNLAFSADNLAISLVWTGAFMDGGRHWTDRGQGNQKPSGENLIRLGNAPGFAKLDSASATWPKEPQALLSLRFRGYKLNAAQQPTFIYQIADVQVMDTPTPEFSDGGRKLSLNRTLSFKNSGSSTLSIFMLLAAGANLEEGPGKTYLIGDTFSLIPGDDIKSRPILRGNGATKQLILPIEIPPGASQITLKYQW